MRVFVAVPIPSEAQLRIAAALKPLQKMQTPVRWTPPEQIHLTLKFLGEITPELYARIEAALAASWSSHPPFVAELRGLGRFPPGAGRGLSIVWVGVSPVPALLGLQAEVERRLAGLAPKKEERPWSPHVTVGRNKREFNFKGLIERLEGKSALEIAPLPVDGFRICESTLRPEGPVYRVCREVRLG